MTPSFDLTWALALVPLLGIGIATLVLATVRRRRGRLERLGDPSTVSRLVPPRAVQMPRIRALLLGLAGALAALAFAGPRWGIERAIVRSGGADVVLALDASLSMRATDERPDRLEKMKQEARRLLAASPNDRFGLIAFAGRSYILTPLTVDRGALELFLDNLDPSIVGQAGSSLARAIRQGTDLLLTTKSGGDRALVIMSDGEAFEPQPDVVEAARRAAQAGVTVVTVGFGTVGGATIPVRTAAGRVEKRDEAGGIVVSRYNPDMLRAAAEASQGVFIDAASTDKATLVRRALATLRRQARLVPSGAERRPRFQLFLIPAVLLVLLDTLLAERRGARRSLPAASRTAAAAVLAAIVAGLGCARTPEGDALFRAGRFAEAAAAYQRAASRDRSARTQYNLGTALIAAGRPDDAIVPLERAAQARDEETRYRALFNLGLIYLERGLGLKDEAAEQAFGAAVGAYKRALQLRPPELDAKWNYELANKKRKESSGGGGGGGGGDTQQQSPQPSPQAPPQTPQQRPSGSLSERQAEQILNSAARDEQEVQGKKQRQNRPDAPPGGKDW